MRTIAWETASQRALRHCSEEVGEEVRTYVSLVKGSLALKHTFWQKVASSHKKVAASHQEISMLMILVFFQI